MALEEWLPRNLYTVAFIFIVISLLQVPEPDQNPTQLPVNSGLVQMFWIFLK